MTVLYRFDENKHAGGKLGGVPLADITADFFEQLPPEKQRSVIGCAYYVEVAKKATSKKKKTTSAVEDGE